MLGNTHMMYGIILAEILWVGYVRRHPGEERRYSRWMFWIVGALGGWSPDLDGLSGIVGNLIVLHEEWGDWVFYVYHRKFSHSLGFLVTMVFAVAWLAVYEHKARPRRQRVNTPAPQPTAVPRRLAGTKDGAVSLHPNLHPLGQVPLERHNLNVVGCVLVVLGYAAYNDATKYYAYFFTIGAMVVFAWTFVRKDNPLYGIVFFGAAILHQACDFLACHWNPFGPWSPWDPAWGLHLYCDFKTNPTPLTTALFILFEILPHGIVVVLLVRVSRDVRYFKHLGAGGLGSPDPAGHPAEPSRVPGGGKTDGTSHEPSGYPTGGPPTGSPDGNATPD